MGSLNRADLIGNLGRDAELKYVADGTPLANFSIATTEKWTSKDGQKQEQTEWHNVSLWGVLAEKIGPYLTKGKQVYVSGRIQTRKYEKDGQTHYATSIKAERIVLLGGGGANVKTVASPDDVAPPNAGALNIDDDLPF